jgi:hypothetical protein
LQCAKYIALLVAFSFIKALTIPANGQNFNGSANAWLQITSNGVDTLTYAKCTWCNRTRKLETNLQKGAKILGLKAVESILGITIGSGEPRC